MLKIDLHIHSVNSGHAYGTIYDILKEAKEKKMDIIAITDHGPDMDGTGGVIHFGMGRRAPNKNEKPKLLWGVELNFIDGDGTLDLNDSILQKLDIVLLGCHSYTRYKDLGEEKNTQAYLKAMDNPLVQIITHPTHNSFPINYQKIIEGALDRKKIVELDLSYLRKYGEKDFDRFKYLVDAVKNRNQKLIVNSDAHFIHEIGDDSILEKYNERLGLTDDLIINNFPDALLKKLGL